MPHLRGFSWIGDERLAVGSLPSTRAIVALPGEGITDLVVCRASLQTRLSQDVWAARAVLGPGHVAHAPMWDNGRRQPPERWAPAATFAADALAGDPDARVLVHCQQGRRRSVLVAYAVLRLRGHDPSEAAEMILSARPHARLVPAYRASVEDWLATRPSLQ